MKPLIALMIVLSLAACDRGGPSQGYGPVENIDKKDIDNAISRETQGVAI